LKPAGTDLRADFGTSTTIDAKVWVNEFGALTQHNREVASLSLTADQIG
jgi:hypothetical protein